MQASRTEKTANDVGAVWGKFLTHTIVFFSLHPLSQVKMMTCNQIALCSYDTR